MFNIVSKMSDDKQKCIVFISYLLLTVEFQLNCAMRFCQKKNKYNFLLFKEKGNKYIVKNKIEMF